MKSPTTTGSSTVHRREPLLRTTTTTPTMTDHRGTQHKRTGEVAGRTAADCATVCCCLPCAMMHFLILAVYKVPTGLCRKIWRKNKQKKRLLNKKNESKCGNCGGVGNGEESVNGDVAVGCGGKQVSAGSETEMWGGFWRNASKSQSQKKKED